MLKCDFQFNYANFQLQANLDMQTQLLVLSEHQEVEKALF